MERIQFTLHLPHTKPVMPIINLMQNARITMPDKKSKARIDKLLLLNNSIFLKSEFAKHSFRVIKKRYTNYAVKIENGFLINPVVLVPAWRGIDLLIFELGSILDFFSREINIAYNLKIPLRKTGFTSVVSYCRKNLPDEEITQVLCDFYDSELHQYFRKMRNRLTHRLPFVWTGITDKFFFPDDPDDDNIKPNIEKEIDILPTCREWLIKILDFVDSTTLLILNQIAQITPYNDKGEEISWEELLQKTRKGLEKQSKDKAIRVSAPSRYIRFFPHHPSKK